MPSRPQDYSDWYDDPNNIFTPQSQGANTTAQTIMGNNLTFQNTLSAADERRDTDGGQIVHYKRRHFQESQISYSNIAKRPIPVANFQWATTDAIGDMLHIASVPYDYLTNCQTNQGFRNNYLWRGSVKVRVHLNSTTFHQGLLWVGYMPGMNRVAATNYIGNSRIQWSNLPSVYINAYTGNDAEMVIPFTHVRDLAFTMQINPDSIEGCIGTFFVGVFSPLKCSADATQRVDGSIFVEFPDAEFYLPVGKDSCVALGNARSYGADFIQQGAQSSTNKTINMSFAGVNNSNIGTELQGDELDSNASGGLDLEMAYGMGAGMDKPFVGTNPVPTMPRCMGTLNNKANIEFIDKLTNNGKEDAPAKKGNFGRDEDEMLISRILATSSFAGEIPWTTTDIVDTVLHAGYITPSPVNVNFRPTTTVPIYRAPQTTMDYLSGQFAYWSGPINMHIKVVASSFQTGLLRVACVYGTTDLTLNTAAQNCQFSAYIDLKDTNRNYDFTFEFPSTVPFLETSSRPKSVLSTDEAVACSVGCYYISVINALTVSANTTNSVQLEVFFSAPQLVYYGLKTPTVRPSYWEGPALTEKERLAERSKVFPRAKIGDLYNLPPPRFVTAPARKPIDDFQVQSSVTVKPEEEQASQAGAGIVIGSNKKVPPIDKNNLLPTFSLRDLAKRYVWAAQSAVTTGYSFNMIEHLAIPTTSIGASDLAHISCLYVGRRGGMRWKVLRDLSGGDVNYYAVSWKPFTITYDPMSRTSAEGRFFSLANNKQPTSEVETSFTTAFNYLINPDKGQADDPYLYYLEGSLNIETGSSTADVLAAGADDFRFGLFVGPPLCYVAINPEG